MSISKNFFGVVEGGEGQFGGKNSGDIDKTSLNQNTGIVYLSTFQDQDKNYTKYSLGDEMWHSGQTDQSAGSHNEDKSNSINSPTYRSVDENGMTITPKHITRSDDIKSLGERHLNTKTGKTQFGGQFGRLLYIKK